MQPKENIMDTKNNSIKKLILLAGLFTVCQSQAVNVNKQGLGEVLIYPYYTVNNNHNTLYTIVNTTADTKAAKVTFREGENGAEVLSFNVYLSAFDVWVGGLSHVQSSFTGHVGEPTALHVTNDTSCSPFLVKSGQEFLPFVIDLDSNNNSMRRTTDGHIEVMELSTFNGVTVAWADHANTGVPQGCDFIEGDWSDNGIYDTADEENPSGGLMGSATILDVSEGTAVGYDAIALEAFWQGPGMHTEVGSLVPNLNNAFPQSLRMNGETALLTDWASGAEAVSASLTQHKLYNEYDITSFLAAKAEWVVTFPSKYLHTNGIQAVPPFTQTWDGINACEHVSIKVWDREEINEDVMHNNVCFSTNVFEFLSSGSPPNGESSILGSDNLVTVYQGNDNNATEAGWAELSFNAPGQAMISATDLRYSGLPTSGFMLQRYVNAGAPPGILAIYAGLFPHRSETKIEVYTDLIFMDGFETP